MATQFTTNPTVAKPVVNPRILAQLSVTATWTDANTGLTVSVEGLTENVGETGTLVNMSKLPPVGSSISLRVMDEGEMLLEVPVEVIRVMRDPGRPMAAFSVVGGKLKEWRETVVTAANEWVQRNWKIDYEEEWVN
jgi:hypothetical protein